MSNNNEHIPSSEFKKYFSGNQSADEKAGFEASIEEGSFESEAMEGFQSLENTSSIPMYIKEMESIVAKKTGLSRSKRLAFPFWKSLSIAATVLVLLGSTYFIATNLPSKNQLAENNIPPSSTDFIDNSNVVEVDENLEQDVITGDSIDVEDFEMVVLDEKLDLPIVEPVNEPEPIEKERAKKDKIVVEVEEEFKATLDEEAEMDDLLSQDLARATKSTAPSSIVATSESVDAKKQEVVTASTATIESGNFQDVSENFENGKTNYQNQNYNEAIGFFQKSSSQNQQVYESEYYIGLSFYNLGKNIKAIKSFDNVIESNTTFTPNAQWYKSIALLDKGDKAEAIKLLKELANGNTGFKNQALDKLKSLN